MGCDTIVKIVAIVMSQESNPTESKLFSDSGESCCYVKNRDSVRNSLLGLTNSDPRTVWNASKVFGDS